VNGITLSDALSCWEQGQNEHNGAFRRLPGTVRHSADIYLLTGYDYSSVILSSSIVIINLFGKYDKTASIMNSGGRTTR